MYSSNITFTLKNNYSNISKSSHTKNYLTKSKKVSSEETTQELSYL